jgi:hypothetical protein
LGAVVDDHVFVSYSRVDGSEFVLGLVDPLTAGRPPFAVWFDQRQPRPGEAWDRQLVEAIRGCRAVLFVITASDWRRNASTGGMGRPRTNSASEST